MNIRNYGLDLLRLVLMYAIVVLHVLGQGGVLGSVTPFSAHYKIAWILECTAYCAANCYALLSGYVNHGHKARVSSLLSIWLQAFCYSLGIALCVWILKPEGFSVRSLLLFSFPVSNHLYWYLSSYVGLFVFLPVIQIGIDHLSEKSAKMWIILSLFTFSFIPTFFQTDAFYANEGYSPFWLIYLYTIGAFFRKFEWVERFSIRKSLSFFCISVIVTYIWKLLQPFWVTPFAWQSSGSIGLVSYLSPTIVIAALSLLLLFAQVRIPSYLQKVVRTLSPAAFGVYLIHEHEFFRSHFINNRFLFLLELPPYLFFLETIFFAFVIFFFCLCIDLIRLHIFRFLQVKEHLLVLDKKFTEL